MKQTLKEAARKYADEIYDPADRGILYRETQDDFIAGAKWHAKQSPWISVEERLPNYKEEVSVLYEYEGRIQIQQSFYLGEKDWKFGSNKILAWMPIPSFDEILEANRDVLERIKETNMYIARDKDGDLYLYKKQPVKYSESWQLCSDNPHDFYKLDSSLFPEVKWEDEEPTEVELVKKED